MVVNVRTLMDVVVSMVVVAEGLTTTRFKMHVDGFCTHTLLYMLSMGGVAVQHAVPAVRAVADGLVAAGVVAGDLVEC